MVIKYSVIIPHYNSESGLKKLLDSIPSDDYIEVLVVDDKSVSDAFKQVIEGSHLNNIKGYRNKGIKGAGSCRNIGIDNSMGKWLVFADSDDFFTKDAFQYINEVVTNVIETDIIFFNVTSQNSAGEVGFRHLKNSNLVLNYIDNYELSSNDKIRLTHNVPWGKVFSASFVKSNAIKFDEVIVSNDVMFSVKSGKLANKVICTKDVVYCVTQGENTLTTKMNVNNFWVRIQVYIRYYHYLTDAERSRIGASPLPLLFAGRKYGIWQLLKAANYFRKNNVPLLKYFSLDLTKLKRAIQSGLLK